MQGGKKPHFFLELLSGKSVHRQSRQRAFQVGEKHYDIGNDLYKRMLEKRMLYTCAYWKDAEDLAPFPEPFDGIYAWPPSCT